MVQRIAKCVALMMLPASGLLADFSYDQSAKITGGMMAGMMKVAGVFSKSAREPIRSTIAVKGDRMVTITGKTASIVDLSKETMTEVNFDKKEYSVMTFAEFRQMMEELAKKQNSKETGEMNVKISVDATGQSRNINGLDTNQTIVKILMEGKDAESGQKGGMTMTADMWLAPSVAGYQEMIQFQTRMAQKLAWGGAGGFAAMAGPQAAKAFQELYKEGSKLNGIPVVQYIKMGVDGAGAQGGQPGAEQAPPPQQQEQQQVEKPSAGGALGSALGGRLGGLGGFGRRKKPKTEEPPAEQPAQQQQAAPQQSGSGQAQAGAPGSFLEMTNESSNFSSAAVDSAKFEVPAGFKQVKSEKRMR
ncbi:MAG TPA: hypothetical protein VN442_16460 [Bryobacteraceae bacterium]|nr:hypothetical protein [Bryobacteraceae bacterium]